MVVLLARKPLLMQQHCKTIGFGWGHGVFVGYAIIYQEKKYSEVHSEAVIYVISLNHMQKFSKTNVFCVLLCLKWYSLISCLLYVYTNLWWCHMHVSAKCFVLGLEGTVQVCGRFLWGQLWGTDI